MRIKDLTPGLDERLLAIGLGRGMSAEIIHGDALDVLRGMESGSVDAIVTDPPAGIAFMGKQWDKDKGGRREWIAWLASVMAEGLRVLKPGGYAFVWALPRTSHWTATALEDAGFEIRDVVHHVFGSGFPKSKALLKPAAENWILARKPGPLRHLRIDECRVGLQSGENPEKLASRSGGSRGFRKDGYVGGAVDGGLPPGWDCSKGRWPANFVMSHLKIPLLRLRSDVDFSTGKVIRSLLDGYSVVPSLQAGEGDSCGEMEPASEVLQSGLRQCLQKGEGDNAPSGGGLHPMRQPVSGAPVLDQEGATEVLRQGVPSRAPANHDRREEPPIQQAAESRGAQGVRRQTEGGGQDRDAASELARWDVREGRLPLCDGATSAGGRSGTGGADDIPGLCGGTSLGHGEEVGAAPDQGGGGPPRQRGQAGQRAGESGDHRQGDALAGAPGVRARSAKAEGGKSGTAERSQGFEVPANVVPEQWLECFEPTGRHEGCERVGTKRVKASNQPGKAGTAEISAAIGFGDADGKPRRAAFYTDPNDYGTEEVPAWRCAPGCPVALLDRQSGHLHGAGFAQGKQAKWADQQNQVYGKGVGSGPNGARYGDTGTASRFFHCFDPDPFVYQAKASRRDRGEGNTHPTVKSTALMRHLCRLIAAPGDLVLDPFAGSGSTGVACLAEGMRFIGIEREGEYVEIARDRITGATPFQRVLF